MAKTFNPSLTFRLGLFITRTMLRAGISMGGMTLLTVRGRKSGELRTTPVTIVKQNGQRCQLGAQPTGSRGSHSESGPSHRNDLCDRVTHQGGRSRSERTSWQLSLFYSAVLQRHPGFSTRGV